MPACRLSEYTARFPIGTEVIYTPAGGMAPIRGRITEAPALFGKLVETCIVRLDNGMIVPCQQLMALARPSEASLDASTDWQPGLPC